MSDAKNEELPFNVACNYVYCCEESEINMNESKIDKYIERMQQSLISD